LTRRRIALLVLVAAGGAAVLALAWRGLFGERPAPDTLVVSGNIEAHESVLAFQMVQARIVELRYFAGLSVEQAAEALEISPATVKRDWTSAKAWLQRELAGDE
jgi:DNA-directed RNA polymerase specialized sigma24 family protein